ncbi:Pyridoxal phosphate-dependent decarboxylase [Corchorus capsularis]|uniref:Pyridoxal phosphate-dependent decarboxylase n=1 Tax=Corchorus capsularis TaxID=210143 RepID=A0A1R3HXH5_COCAP|nr:Pyridoxal phosphate-dependent decarboxylase [Corchorus capsularis]
MGSLSSMNNIEPAGKSFPNVVNINPLDPEEFRRQGHMMIDFLADYYQNIDKYPVLSQVEPGYLRKLLPMSAPDVGEPVEAILEDVQKHIIPAARDQMLTKIGRHNIGKLVVYGSDQTHCALAKAAKISGIAPHNIRAIRTKMETLFGLSPESLRTTIIKDVNAGLIPLYLCATVGTTSTTAVDPVGPLCNVAQEYGIWVHVDAAYAGSACICPEFRHFINGVEGSN